MISFSGTPTVVWRRTGEICLVAPEFCMLTEWSMEELVGRKKYIYEVCVIRHFTRPGLMLRSFSKINPSWSTGKILPRMHSKTPHSPSTRIVCCSNRQVPRSLRLFVSQYEETCSISPVLSSVCLHTFFSEASGLIANNAGQWLPLL